MCGIAAFLLHPQSRSEAQWDFIKDSFTRNLLLNEERGEQATGCAVVRNDGYVQLAKAPVPASAFVASSPYRFLMDAVGSRTTLILGHTRLPTKGDPAIEANNHPIRAGHVVGAHNEHVLNDDELFARGNLRRRAQVDSEIIFRLLSMISPLPRVEGYLEEARTRLRMLRGHLTFLACDTRDPGRLLALRDGNPLCLLYQRDWQVLIFSSSYLFMRRAFGRAIVTEDLAVDHLTLFAAEAIPDLGSLPVATYPLAVGGASDGE